MVALAAIALAEKIVNTDKDDPSVLAYGMVLGTVLIAAERNQSSLGFSSLDDVLLTAVVKTQEELARFLNDRPISKVLEFLLRAGRPEELS